MASRVGSSTETGPTLTLQSEPEPLIESTSSVRLRLKKPQNKKKVVWSEETVDNEGMNKRKSKCCCIYKKPHAYGESSSESESEDECDNCPGHKNPDKHNDPPPSESTP